MQVRQLRQSCDDKIARLANNMVEKLRTVGLLASCVCHLLWVVRVV